MTHPTPPITVAASGIVADPCPRCGFRLKGRDPDGKVHCLLCGWPRAGDPVPQGEL
mgnify:CR=1 FL=1